MTSARCDAAGFCSRAPVERADNTMIKSLDTILLLLTDLGLQFYDVPEFEHIFLDLLDVDCCWWQTGSSHLLNICLELANAFTHDFRIDDVTLCRHLSVWCSRESD